MISFEEFQNVVNRLYPEAEKFAEAKDDYSCSVRTEYSTEFISHNKPSGLWFVDRETAGGRYQGSGVTLEAAFMNLQPKSVLGATFATGTNFSIKEA